MKLILLPFKNILANWWRSATLGLFVSMTAFIAVLFSSFFLTLETNLRDTMVNGLVGDLQIRPGASEEGDLIQLKNEWSGQSTLNPSQTAAVTRALAGGMQLAEYTGRIRWNAMFISDHGTDQAMLIGLDPKARSYQAALRLAEGRYLDPARTHEVVLSRAQANRLQVKVGETIGILAETKDGSLVDSFSTVVGIGELNSIFASMTAIAFADITGVREITGFAPGEASDLIAFVPDRARADEAAAALRRALGEVGLAAGEVKVSTWREMGGVIAGMVKSYGAMFDLLLGTLLMVVCILAINLVFMASLERQGEIGTLRAIGFGRSAIVGLFAAEIMLVVVVFACLGFLAGAGLVGGLAKVSLPAGPQWSNLLGDRFHLRLDVKGALPSLVVTIFLTLGAVAWPAYKAASVKPVEALRHSDQV